MGAIYELLSPVLARAKFVGGHFEHWHWCPACKEIHRYAVEQPFSNGAKWSFDGNVEKPTFSPSMKITWGLGPEPPAVCHYFITGGKIAFCGDCTHDLKGQTVDLQPIPEARLKSWGIF